MKAFAYLVFPNSILSVLPEGSSLVQGEPMDHGIITSVTHGAMSGICQVYILLLLVCINSPIYHSQETLYTMGFIYYQIDL